jgi:hypothetical protein
MVSRLEKYDHHLRRNRTSLVTCITFGWRSLAFKNPDVKQIYEGSKCSVQSSNAAVIDTLHGFEELAVASQVSASMLDYFPGLRNLPDFLNPSKRRGNELNEEEISLYKLYMLRVKERNEKGIKAKNDILRAQESATLNDPCVRRLHIWGGTPRMFWSEYR